MPFVVLHHWAGHADNLAISGSAVSLSFPPVTIPDRRDGAANHCGPGGSSPGIIGRMSKRDPGTADQDIEEVIKKELLLLQPDVRARQVGVLSLLHEAFREFGASGRTWDRSQIAGALAANPGSGAQAEDMRAARLGKDVVLLTYLARTPERDSLRSSLWVRDAIGWRLFFHQGTLCP